MRSVDADSDRVALNLREWLEVEELGDFTFNAECWTERECDQDALIDALGREITTNYADRAWLERRLACMGYERLAAHVRATVLLSAGNTRTGDFGEIVSTLMLRRHKGFFVPLLRLRYKDSPGGTQRLLDIVAFKFRDPPDRTVIAISEVKTRTNSAPSIAAEAAGQLAGAVKDLPLSLSFMDRRLTAEGKHFLADRVAALLDPDARFVLEQHVFVVTDSDAVHADTLHRLDDEPSASEITASLVLLDGLAQLIADAYDSAGGLRDLTG